MAGFNLPPGCSVRDIPGNRPEDEAVEAFYDAFYAAEEDARKMVPSCGDAYVEILAAWVWDRIGKAYSEGYSQGQGDEAMAQQYNQDAQRVADHIDGYDRDDLGESPDY